MRRRFEQVVNLETDGPPQRFHGAPAAVALLEPADRLVDPESSLDFEVGVNSVDFTEDLKSIDVPVLVIHSEDDQIVPYADSGPLAAKLLKNGTLKSYNDLPHGCHSTHPELINADILAFIRGEAAQESSQAAAEPALA